MAFMSMWGRWGSSAAQDLRFGRRQLTRTPLGTTVMVVSIALGIGVAAAVFTLVDVMLLRPLPFPMAERLVVPFQTVSVKARARQDTVAWTFARYELLKQAAAGFDDMGFADWSDALVRLPNEDDHPIRLEAITRSLLSTFSIEPKLGRSFAADEDSATHPTTVGMISDRLWRTAFGASPGVIGTTLEIDGSPVTVIGVMPPHFTGFTIGADAWLPVRMMSRIDPSARWTEKLAGLSGTVIARTSRGVTLDRERVYLRAALPLIDQIATNRFVADKQDRGIGVVSLAEARRHPLVKPILALMSAAVIGLLAIVCANIASILLARGHARRGEMGVRLALGASGGRVARQVLTECALLGFVALPCGILLGSFCAQALAALRPALPQNWVLLRGTDLLAGASFDPNMRVVVFASLVTIAATLLFGIGPAIAAARVDAKELIATSGDLHATSPVKGRQLLVAAQIALATMLLISAGLMLRSLDVLLHVDLGFQPKGVLTLHVASNDTSASARIRRADFIAQLTTMPGITSVATSGCVPFDVACLYTLGVHSIGGVGGDRPIEAELHGVSSGYFRTLGISLVGGRTFVDADTMGDHPVAVIGETMARELYGDRSPVGKALALDQPNARPMTIVGVVRDVRFRSVDAARSPAVYTLQSEDQQSPRFGATLLVRTSMSGPAVATTVSRAAQASAVPMSLSSVRMLDEIVSAEMSATRVVAVLLLGFALTALALASLGVYGVVAFVVSQRSKELGLRLVLGADERTLLWSTVGRGAMVVAIGLGSGALVAIGTSRLVASFLFGIKSLDATTYVAALAIVGVVGVVATFLPARRIMRIDAGMSLRG